MNLIRTVPQLMLAAAVLPGGTAWYAGGRVRALERTSTYGVLHQLASTGPLAPAGAFGTCPTATLVRTTALAGGRLGTCAP